MKMEADFLREIDRGFADAWNTFDSVERNKKLISLQYRCVRRRDMLEHPISADRLHADYPYDDGPRDAFVFGYDPREDMPTTPEAGSDEDTSYFLVDEYAGGGVLA